MLKIEDGGERAARGDVKVLVRGAAKTFADRYAYDAFLELNRLTIPQLLVDVRRLI